MKLIEYIPWRVRLGLRRIITNSLYSSHYNHSERFLSELGISNLQEHLIERAVKGISHNYIYVNVRCIEARTVPGTWEQVIRMLPRVGIATLADVGCGNENPGRILEKLGIDCAYSDIEPFTHIPNFTRMNFNDGIAYPDLSFDYAVSVDVIEHLDSTRRFCRELKRISRKGFIVATPNPLSVRSINLLRRTGYFEWFGKEEVTWHINPVFHHQMEVIANEFGMDYELSGNTCFWKNHDPVENSEALIYRFSVRS